MGHHSVIAQAGTDLNNLGRAGGDFVGGLADMFTGKHPKYQTPVAPLGTLDPPQLGDVQAQSENAQRLDLQKRRASRTLFTGGQGVLDQPTTASTTLLGV